MFSFYGYEITYISEYHLHVREYAFEICEFTISM